VLRIFIIYALVALCVFYYLVTLNINKERPQVMLQIACRHRDIATTRSYGMTSEDATIQAMQGW